MSETDISQATKRQEEKQSTPRRLSAEGRGKLQLEPQGAQGFLRTLLCASLPKQFQKAALEERLSVERREKVRTSGTNSYEIHNGVDDIDQTANAD